MNDEMVLVMNRRYPDGFLCADITATSAVSSMAFEAWSMLEIPLLLHVHARQLQELIEHLIEHGVAPGTNCSVMGKNISATLGDIVLKTREADLTELFLVIGE